MKKSRVVEIAHQIIKDNLTRNDIAIDMTLGNGYDTIELLKYAKSVYSFDIQEKCIDEFRKKQLSNVNLILDNHNNVDKYCSSFKLAIYNLGYLPNGDKNILTNVNTTLSSLYKLLKIIEKEGIILMVVYTGHEEGLKESKGIDNYLKTLSQKEFEVIKYNFLNQVNNPPYLITIRRIGEMVNS